MPAKKRSAGLRAAPIGARSDSLRGGAPAQERELRAQGRKTMRRLLDAGRVVFEQRGFHAARVDDIVKMARTSHGTFYLYFANKEDLFKALAHDAMAEMAALGDELGPVTGDAVGRATLRAWIARFCDTYALHGTVIRTWTEGEIEDSDLMAEGRTLLLRLSEVLSERMRQAGWSPSQAAAAGVACLSMLERFNYFVQASQVDFERDEIVETLTNAAHAGFFGGAAAPAAGLRRAARR